MIGTIMQKIFNWTDVFSFRNLLPSGFGIVGLVSFLNNVYIDDNPNIRLIVIAIGLMIVGISTILGTIVVNIVKYKLENKKLDLTADQQESGGLLELYKEAKSAFDGVIKEIRTDSASQIDFWIKREETVRNEKHAQTREYGEYKLETALANENLKKLQERINNLRIQLARRDIELDEYLHIKEK